GGFEGPVERQWLADIGFDGRDAQALQPPGGVVEDVPVRIEDRDRAALGQAGSFQEVAGARADVGVARAGVATVALDHPVRRTPPDHAGEEAEDHGVVDPQEERGVLALAGVRGIVTVHGARALRIAIATAWICPTMDARTGAVNADA